MITRHSIRQSALIGAALSFSALGCNDSKTVGTIENTGGTSAVITNNSTGGAPAVGTTHASGGANAGGPSTSGIGGVATGGAPSAGGGGNGTAGSGGAPAGTGGAAADAGTVKYIENDAGELIMPLPVLDPTGTYGGKTYAEWGAAWWQWLLGLPGPDFPTSDSTGSHCALGQSGGDDGGAASPVFFLADAMSPLTVTRTCTVAANQMLLLLLGGGYWDNASQPADKQLTDDQLKALLTSFDDALSSLTLEIDGKTYGSGVSDFNQYLIPPTDFLYTIPNTSTNYAWKYPGSYPTTTFSGFVPKSFFSGYWILLAPLPVGSHAIHYSVKWNAIAASVYFAGAAAGHSDVTYNLTVE